CAGNLPRRGRRAHLRRLRRGTPRLVPRLGGGVRRDARRGIVAPRAAPRAVSSALRRAHPADPTTGGAWIRPTPSELAGETAWARRGAEASERHGSREPPILRACVGARAGRGRQAAARRPGATGAVTRAPSRGAGDGKTPAGCQAEGRRGAPATLRAAGSAARTR